MPRFNPSIVVEDIDSKPVKFGAIEDPAARKEMTHLRSEIAKAGKDAPERVPALEEELMTFISQHQRNLTLGEAVVQALRTPLTDDEHLSESTKLDHMEWATKVRGVQSKGATEMVEFSNDQMEKIKVRVNRCWTAPEVIWRLNQAIRAAATSDPERGRLEEPAEP